MRMLLLMLALAPSLALGAAEKTDTVAYQNTSSTNTYNVLEDVALNGAEATRTLTVTTRRRMATLKVAVFYTDGGVSSITTLTATPYCSIDGTNYAIPQVRDLSAGTVSDLADTMAATADFSEMLFYGVGGCESFKIIFAGNNTPDAADLVSVQAVSVVGE